MGCTISRECQKCGSADSTTRNNLGLDLCCNCAHEYHRFKSQRQFYCKAKEKLYPRSDLSAVMSLKRISSGRNWEGPSIRSPYQPSKHVEELYLQEDSQNQVVYQWLNTQKLKLEERYYSIVNTASSSSSGAAAATSSSHDNNNTSIDMVAVEENALEVSVSYSDNNIDDDNASTSSKSSSGRHYCRAEVDQEQHADQGPSVCRQIVA